MTKHTILIVILVVVIAYTLWTSIDKSSLPPTQTLPVSVHPAPSLTENQGSWAEVNKVEKQVPSLEEFLATYRGMEQKPIGQNDIHHFVTTFRAGHKQWGVDRNGMEGMIMEMIKDWSWWSKLELKASIFWYMNNHKQK